ncbi:hypothetical protein [Hydrogenobacter hydrogenophilus]|uniref:Uncharacterized protein n=1 Tax=Hydrogenobacter hydrogenophilus TaxID=35835 RepID=A0A285NRH3_9AQUI|nr:hypothetical protein [Hydrogenobacter hydrogenophilus]SNZ12112.1 hypothetical protein SAMN06265353_0434 [Hydrogenobacter hydrogenophilus]
MKRLYIFVLFLALLSGCVKKEYVLKTQDFKELNIPFNIPLNQFLPIKELNKEGSYAFLYYGGDGYIHLYADGSDKVINKPIVDRFKGGAFDGLDYKIEGDTLYVAQWVRYLGEPRTKKVILIKTNLKGENPQYTLVSSTNESIGKPMIETDGKRSVLLVWSDESNGYGVAYALSTDGGKTFPQETILRPANIAANLDVYTPFYDPKNGFSVIYTTDKEVRARRLKDNAEVVLFKFEEGYQYTPYVEKTDGKLYLFMWRLPKNNPADVYGKYKLTFLAYKDPFEKPYATVEKEYERVYTYIQPAVVNEKVPVFFSVNLPPKGQDVYKADGEELSKRINLVYSWDGGELKKAVEDKDNDYIYAQIFSSAAVSEDGVLDVFVDRRYLLPQLWAVYVKDGKTVSFGPLEEPWVETSYFSKALYLGKGIFRVYYLVKDDKKGTWFLRARDIKADALNNPYKIEDKGEKQDRLEKALKKFAECQVKDDLDCVYSFFDPVGQKQYSLDVFKKNAETLKIKFKDYKCSGKVVGNTNIAVVYCDYTYTLPPAIGNVPVPEGKRQITEKKVRSYWVYIKGNWKWAIETVPGRTALQW